MKDALMVLSGGLDSTVMLHEFADRIALAVNFRYGSNHNEREGECARRSCRKLGIELVEIDLGFMGEYFHSSLLEGADAIPTGDYDEGNMKSTVVPFRNGIMLAVAAGFAESRGLTAVMLANHSGDHAIYPDCRPGFVKAMGEAIKAGTYDGLKLEAPYTNLTKAEIVVKGARMGVDFNDTYSCYRGEEAHCGECGTCRERKEAFRIAGVDDPTVYVSPSDR